jgi:hypothetical protein
MPTQLFPVAFNIRSVETLRQMQTVMRAMFENHDARAMCRTCVGVTRTLTPRHEHGVCRSYKFSCAVMSAIEIFF